MKVAYSWLRDYVRTTTQPQDLGEKFQLTSSTIEEIQDNSLCYEGIVVAYIEEVRPHPGADRLQIAMVSLGKEKRQIVSGAPNMEAGQTVVLALPGAVLHPLKGSELAIQESVIRGERSMGMLCGSDELGLDLQAGPGLLLLPSEIKPGTKFSEILELGDTVLDLEITANRPDLYSYIGLAREVAAFEKRTLIEPPIATLEDDAFHAAFPIDVHVETGSSCNRYSALCLEEIEIAPSPLWMQVRLLHSGIRPVNNVVDIGNYVMLEFGQPLHMFDLDRLTGLGTERTRLEVRLAEAGEPLELLNGRTLALRSEDIVIAAEGKVIDLAGIMGGETTSIHAGTTRVMVESAHFQQAVIRRSSRAHGLRTDASARFEKGLDPEMTVAALKRAAYLLQQIAGGRVSSPLYDAYPSRGRTERPRIHVSFARIQQLLGVHVSAAETKSILQKLGFQLPLLTKSSFETVPPSWRRDVTLPEDIVEELIRLWGFDRLPSTLPGGVVKAPFPNRGFEGKNALRKTLAALGMYECRHQPFASGRALQQVGVSLESAIKLPEPLSRENEYLIPSLAVPLLHNMALTNAQHTELALFELGHVFLPPRQEREQLVLLWRSQDNPELLYRRAKTALYAVAKTLGHATAKWEFTPASTDLPGYLSQTGALHLENGGRQLGLLGVINEPALRQLKVRTAKNVVIALIDLEQVLNAPALPEPFRPVSAYPGIGRDLTLVIDEDMPVQRIASILLNHSQPLLASHVLTDIYRGKPLDPAQKSVTVHFEYSSLERTLTDAEVNQDQDILRSLFQTELHARIT